MIGDFQSLGKILIIFGVIIIGIGLLITLVGRIPYLGHLPGDIHIQKKNFTFYFPITTCILLSILLTLILSLIFRR